jgi:hypothetical protein
MLLIVSCMHGLFVLILRLLGRSLVCKVSSWRSLFVVIWFVCDFRDVCALPRRCRQCKWLSRSSCIRWTLLRVCIIRPIRLSLLLLRRRRESWSLGSRKRGSWRLILLLVRIGRSLVLELRTSLSLGSGLSLKLGLLLELRLISLLLRLILSTISWIVRVSLRTRLLWL